VPPRLTIRGENKSRSDSHKYHNVPFPKIVLEMVENTHNRDPSILEWVEDGRAFVIKNKGLPLTAVLLEYFRHGKYTSFQRQLNMYGWSKKTKGEYAGCFTHSHFHRYGATDELLLIQRKTLGSQKSMIHVVAPKLFKSEDRKVNKFRSSQDNETLSIGKAKIKNLPAVYSVFKGSFKKENETTNIITSSSTDHEMLTFSPFRQPAEEKPTCHPCDKYYMT